ncbi:MAG: hypothetical protein M3Q55_15275 [Acidobacteriota bacterium]|nr:hypothetical protein [Acidobacteriota bacterium]
MSTSDISMIVMACAAMLAAITHSIPRLTQAYRERSHAKKITADADRVTADTVHGIVEAMRTSFEARLAEMRSAFESRIAAMEAEHTTCLLSLAAVRAVNAGQETRIQLLETQVASQSATIARYERALALGEEERTELQRAIETGERRTLHRDASHVDAVRVDATRTTEEP